MQHQTVEAEERELVEALTGLIEMGYLDVVEEDGVDEIRLRPTPKGLEMYRGDEMPEVKQHAG